jgi:hydroxymethylbilane synthase
VIKDNQLEFHGTLHNPEGTMKVEVKRIVPLSQINHLGVEAAREILSRGGRKIIEQIKNL